MDHFMTDNLVLIKKDSSRIKNIKASVQNKIYINDVTLPIVEGDILEHSNSAGIKNFLKVVNAIYYDHSRLGHIEIEYEKTDNTPKVYLDTNIISRINDFRVKEKEIQSLAEISERYQKDEIKFFTSSKAKEEIQKIDDEKKKGLILFFCNLITNVPSANLIEHTSACFGSVTFGTSTFGGGGSVENPLFSRLKSFFDIDDAEHIFQAEKSELDYFLTLDKETILNRINQNQKEFDDIGLKIKIFSPGELAEALRSQDNQ